VNRILPDRVTRIYFALLLLAAVIGGTLAKALN
jgi:hypothetical protein